MTVTAALLVYLAWRTGVTADEPAHLVSARLYWERADVLRPGDMLPLIKIASGWVPLQFDLPLPDDIGRPGENRHEWEVSLEMMEKLPWGRIQPLFFFTRLPMIVFPLATVALVWWWGRQLFTPALGVLAAALFALEPTALAHGAIFKNDHAATFAYLCFWYTLWRYWRARTVKAAALVGIAIGLCLLSKLSLLFVVGLGPVAIAVADAAGRRVGRRTAVSVLVAVGIAYGATLAAAQFEAHRLTSLELWRADSNPNMPAAVAAAARIFSVLPVPDRMWEGMSTLFAGSGVRTPVYLFGEMRPGGHPLYFLACLLVKSPVTLLALGAAAVPLLIIGAVRRRLGWADLLWLIPGPLYVFLASLVPYQLGVRLILPALPFGVLIAVFAVDQMRQSRAGRAAVAASLVLFAVEAIHVYPHGMSFFNVAAGGPAAGFHYLSDSNLDWGQGLGELSRWTRQNHALPIKISYFGTDIIFRHFGGWEAEVIAPPWNDQLAKGVTRFRPQPGVYYAISPTLLPGHFFAEKYRDFYAEFRSMKPVARPGYSIFVYRLDLRTP